jgi:hypothetical protein
MKRYSILFVVLLLLTVVMSATLEASVPIKFNDTKLGWISVGSFDWAVGNAVGVGSVPQNDLPACPAAQPFTLYYQAKLLNFLDPGGNVIAGTGLNTDYEITVIAAFGETGCVYGPAAVFSFDATNATNYIKIYIDPARNASNLAGTGFNDGTLLMQGNVVAQDSTASVITGGTFTANLLLVNTQLSKNVAQYDQFNGNDYAGVGTVTGTGITAAAASIDIATVNPAYINPASASLFTFEALTNSSQVAPFLQQDPSQSFYDAMTGLPVTPKFGDCTGGGYPCIPNAFSSVNGSTKSGETVDFQFQADANSSFDYTRSVCCVDIEKQVSVEPFPNAEWMDADSCSDSDVPVVIAPHNAMYRLIVKNCGGDRLTNVVVNDPTLGITNYSVGSLEPMGLPGDQKILTGQDISQLAFDANQCTAAGTFPNTSDVSADCSDPAQSPVTDENSACWQCLGQTGGCRMTGGHVAFLDDGEALTVPYGAETYNVTQTEVKKGKKFVLQNDVTWYTLGGQIGAPQAGCLSGPDPKQPYGDWEHVHHQGTVSWDNGTTSFTGGFAFHSGTASAPEEAFIKCIVCADPGWCVQARCAPYKQIFWEGTGVFKNIDAGTQFPNGCKPNVYDPPHDSKWTIHYYRAHVGDFGEPAGNTEQQKPADQCGWRSSGVSILDGILGVAPTVLPWPPDDKFGDKGGQNCSAYPGCGDTCGECPDWYEIEIHCTEDPNSPIIYKVGNFITHGNHQIHPEVGQHCPF